MEVRSSSPMNWEIHVKIYNCPSGECLYTKHLTAGLYLCCHLVNAFVLHRFAKLFGHLVHETQTFGQFSKYLKTMKYCDSLFADSVIVCCSII